MLCRDAREYLRAQRDGRLEPSQAEALQAHLVQCEACRALQLQLRQPRTVSSSQNEKRPVVSAADVPGQSISTDRIMRAVQQQRQVTAQLSTIRQLQQSRVARMRKAGAVGFALSFLLVSSLPLLFLLIVILQTDFAIQLLSPLESGIDALVVLGEYLQRELIMLSRNSFLLSGLAFIVVVMMGMWLRLMRPPHEA